MAFGIRHLSRSVLPRARFALAAMVLTGATGVGSHPTAPRSLVPQLMDKVAYHEVRLRKLHLVRPDLIPYPVAYDIYC